MRTLDLMPALMAWQACSVVQNLLLLATITYHHSESWTWRQIFISQNTMPGSPIDYDVSHVLGCTYMTSIGTVLCSRLWYKHWYWSSRSSQCQIAMLKLVHVIFLEIFSLVTSHDVQSKLWLLDFWPCHRTVVWIILLSMKRMPRVILVGAAPISFFATTSAEHRRRCCWVHACTTVWNIRKESKQHQYSCQLAGKYGFRNIKEGGFRVRPATAVSQWNGFLNSNQISNLWSITHSKFLVCL